MIQNFFTFNQNLKDFKTDSALLHLEKIIEKHFLENKILQQTKMTDFYYFSEILNDIMRSLQPIPLP